MIVTNWTMRRFHIASLLALLCARPVMLRPVVGAPATSPVGGSGWNATAAAETADTLQPPNTLAFPTEKPVHVSQEPSGEEGTLFQGDIRLTHYDDPYDLYRTVFNRMIFDVEGSGETSPLFDDTITSRLWPDATVPYRFASHLTMEYRYVFLHAMAEWSSSTCITFEQIGDVNITEDDYLVFTDTAGCSSYVGRIGGPQEVSIDVDCLSKGHAMHELGHALGLWHEHSRWDRDTYIKIVRENIRDNAYYNFGTISEEKWSHTEEDLGYDLLSIMHYGAKSFSKNGEDTIEVVLTLGIPDCAIVQMGQRRMLSRKDKLKTSRMYQCENDTNPNENCVVNYTVTTEPPTTTPTPPPPTPPPVDNKLFTNDRLRLDINTTLNESLLCTDLRCHKKQCTYISILDNLICDEKMDFTIRHYEDTKNKKIKNGDVIVLQSLHKVSRWLHCSGQNICSISDCPLNSGANTSSNVSECVDQRFRVVSSRKILRDGDPFTLKHEFNETYVYCTSKWCDMLPECSEDEVQSNSENRVDIVCHSPMTFYVKKLYT